MHTSDRAGWLAFAGLAVCWIVVLARILRHSIYVSHDTIINYAHVWYAADRLWDGHGLPLRMPALGHGEAFTFPYGFLPWSAAALLRPLVGDWSVTLTLVLVTLAVIAATFWAFPEVAPRQVTFVGSRRIRLVARKDAGRRHSRSYVEDEDAASGEPGRRGTTRALPDEAPGRSWWGAAVLAEPAIVSSPLIGQLPFLSGTALLLVAIGAWRRDRTGLAVVAAGLAQATHPAIVLPMALCLVLGRLPWEPRRGALLRSYAVSLVLAVPALWVTLNAPVVEESSIGTKAFGFVATIGPRSLLVLVPVALVVMQRRWRSAWLGPGILLALLVANVAMWVPLGMPWAWRALGRQPDTRMTVFTGSGDFVPDATYRLLRVADGKIGMYQLLQGGGRLDSEFFPESIQRRSWPTTDDYLGFLAGRRVDFVMVWEGYDSRFGTNEHTLLEELQAAGCVGSTAVRQVAHTFEYDLYSIEDESTASRYCATTAKTAREMGRIAPHLTPSTT